jgi:predicted dithiol-disulfide oxidoreductase (DUF899 family)
MLSRGMSRVRQAGDRPARGITARTALLAKEIELRRTIERVAAQRRALPTGGTVTGDYRFEGEGGPIDFAGLFGDKQTLAVYSYMFGPQRERPCPMCYSSRHRRVKRAPPVSRPRSRRHCGQRIIL